MDQELPGVLGSQMPGRGCTSYLCTFPSASQSTPEQAAKYGQDPDWSFEESETSISCLLRNWADEKSPFPPITSPEVPGGSQQLCILDHLRVPVIRRLNIFACLCFYTTQRQARNKGSLSSMVFTPEKAGAGSQPKILAPPNSSTPTPKALRDLLLLALSKRSSCLLEIKKAYIKSDSYDNKKAYSTTLIIMKERPPAACSFHTERARERGREREKEKGENGKEP